MTLLLVLPTFMLMILTIAHATLVFHGRAVAAAAAQDGLHAAQAEEGDGADGEERARATLALGPRFSSYDVSVGIDGDDTTVTARVQASIDSVLPFFTEVDIEVSGPKERFYAEDERR